MFKLKVKVGSDSFWVSTDSPPAEVRPFLEDFLKSRGAVEQAAVDALTRELEKDVDAQAADVAANTPK